MMLPAQDQSHSYSPAHMTATQLIALIMRMLESDVKQVITNSKSLMKNFMHFLNSMYIIYSWKCSVEGRLNDL